MEKLFVDESSLFKKNINDIIKDSPTKKVIEDLIKLNLLRSASKDEGQLFLAELYNLVGVEMFADIIELMAGRLIKFPAQDYFINTIKIAVCYYYKFLKNKSWDEIENLIPGEDISHIQLGMQTIKLDQFIKEYKSRLVKDKYIEP